MDIFKLFYNHDQRLDKLAKRNTNKTKEVVETSLRDFMTPTPTFSKLYMTGTRLKEEQFGINILTKYDEIIHRLDRVWKDYQIQNQHAPYSTLPEAISATSIGEAMVLSEKENESIDIASLTIDEDSNVGHRKDELREVLLKGHHVLYKEQAHNRFDLHLFSKENIYPRLFDPLKELVDDSFRFFSINSKRMRSEKHFYFETWTLANPPHGAEEVFAETVL